MKAKEIEAIVINRLRLQHRSHKTEQSYMGWIRRYMAWLVSEKPIGEPADKMGAWLSYLALHERVAASTQNQAFNALLYMYRALGVELGNVKSLRAKAPRHDRHAPSPADISAMFEHLRDANGFPIRLLVKLLYGCGLRVSEPLKLRVKDVRFDRNELMIRGAKGGKDRVVQLPASLRTALHLQIQAARLVFEGDAQTGQAIQLPNAYSRKAPSAARQWGWMFVFPGHVPVVQPRSGELLRYHLHAANIQREVKRACGLANLVVPFTPHHLRHAYATHALDAGSNIHDVKACLGHENVETTMIYVHPQVDRVRSPLEVLEGVV